MVEFNNKLYALSNGVGGTIFEYDKLTKSIVVKHVFSTVDASPKGSLTVYGDSLFGLGFGSTGVGALFKYTPSTDTYVVKHAFSVSDGSGPYGSLLLSNNLLYGMTIIGGDYSAGVIFRFNPNTAPTVSTLRATGATNVGDTISLAYNFYDQDSDLEGDSTYQWYRDGVAINGAINRQYTIKPADENTEIAFSVTPIAQSGIFVGTNVLSRGYNIYPSTGPVTSNAEVTGRSYVGYYLSAQYNYSDVNNDTERSASFQWFRGGVEINGATSTTYLVQASDFNKLISFSVASTDQSGRTGTTVYSPDTQIVKKPRHFTFNYSEGIAFGSFEVINGKIYGTYFDANGTGDRPNVIFEYNPIDNSFIDRGQTGDNVQDITYGTAAIGNKIFGITRDGGEYAAGFLFEYDLDTDIYTKKYDFGSTDSDFTPMNIIAAGNKIIGITGSGGTDNMGILFEYNLDNNIYTKKYEFSGVIDGSYPKNLIVVGNKIIGITETGGTYDEGVLFEYNLNTNTYTKKYDFGVAENGYFPSNLVSLNNRIFGLTSMGGTYDEGVLFEYNLDTNSYTNKYNFGTTEDDTNPLNLVAKDNKIFIITNAGGVMGGGILSEYNLSTDVYTKRHDFNIAPFQFMRLDGQTLYSSFNESLYSTSLNISPAASNITVSGTPKVGQTLSVSYEFSDGDGDLEGASAIHWFRDGNLISSSTSTDYEIVTADSGKSLSFSVTPTALEGDAQGEEVFYDGEDVHVLNSAPSASNLVISGTPKVDQILSASYDYSDVDGDQEDASIIQWLRDGVIINGASSPEYKLVSADSEKNISFSVTPRAGDGEILGVKTNSNQELKIDALPSTGVTINLPGSIGDGLTDISIPMNEERNVGVINNNGTNVLGYINSRANFNGPESSNNWQAADHSIRISDLNLDTEWLTLIIASEPQILILKKGETRGVDLDKDGINDININFAGIYSNRVDLTIKSLKQDILVIPEKTDKNNQVITQEEKLSTPVNSKLTNKLLGRMLLQVETRGQAWYLEPISRQRYYLADGAMAYGALRKFGLGITNSDLAKIPLSPFSVLPNDYKKNPRLISSTFSNKLKGRILLQVESHGEAWYVNPADGFRYYLSSGEATYKIMKNISLGITNANIQSIKVGRW